MQSKNVLISGASIAGPALAYWLRRHGFNPTVVERAPTLRQGGYAVDFRGAAHLGVLERMGILDEVRRLQTRMGAMTYVDNAGKPLASLPAAIMSGDVEILRGDLSRILYDLTGRPPSTSSATPSPPSPRPPTGWRSPSSGPRRAPSIWSSGPTGSIPTCAPSRSATSPASSTTLATMSRFFTATNHLNLDYTGRFYNVPGKAAGIYSARDNTEAKVMFLFASPPLAYDRRDTNQQKQRLWRTDSSARAGKSRSSSLPCGRHPTSTSTRSVKEIHLEAGRAGASRSSATPATGPRWAAWGPAWRWSRPMCWPGNSLSPAATAASRSPATRRRCGATPGAARSSRQGPVRCLHHRRVPGSRLEPDAADAPPPALEGPDQRDDHQDGQRHHPQRLPGRCECHVSRANARRAPLND